MLTKISVSGFKSLQNVEDVELGVVNVFVGANGSGKTNLLEAIGLLSAAVDGPVDDQAFLRRGVRISPPQLYKSSFQQKTSEKIIVINSAWYVSGEAVKYQIEMDKTHAEFLSFKDKYIFNEKILEPTPKWDRREGKVWSGSQSGQKNLALHYFLILAYTVSNYAIYSPNTPTLRGNQPDLTQREPIGLAGGRLAEAVGELLDADQETFGDLDRDELFELLDWVDDIAIVPPSRELVSGSVPTLREIIRFTDRWMADEDNRLSAYDASEGALYVLFALVLALHPQAPRLFAIDNFDQAMHPRLARATTRLFCQLMLNTNPTRQALLTTHNPLVLDGLDLRDDRIRLFAVERGSKGDTQIHRVEVSEEVLAATQEGLSLSNLWILGRLGGVPDIF